MEGNICSCEFQEHMPCRGHADQQYKARFCGRQLVTDSCCTLAAQATFKEQAMRTAVGMTWPYWTCENIRRKVGISMLGKNGSWDVLNAFCSYGEDDTWCCIVRFRYTVIRTCKMLLSKSLDQSTKYFVRILSQQSLEDTTTSSMPNTLHLANTQKEQGTTNKPYILHSAEQKITVSKFDPFNCRFFSNRSTQNTTSTIIRKHLFIQSSSCFFAHLQILLRRRCGRIAASTGCRLQRFSQISSGVMLRWPHDRLVKPRLFFVLSSHYI